MSVETIDERARRKAEGITADWHNHWQRASSHEARGHLADLIATALTDFAAEAERRTWRDVIDLADRYACGAVWADGRAYYKALYSELRRLRDVMSGQHWVKRP